MNEKECQAILAELYAADPSLRQYDSELKKVIKKLIATKPRAEMNEVFRRELRSALLKKAEELKPPTTEDVRGAYLKPSHLAFAGTGAVIILAVAIISYALINKTNETETSPAETPKVAFSEASITELSAEAFGDLSSRNLQSSSGEIGAYSEQESTLNNTDDIISVDTDTETVMGGTNYNYIYNYAISLPDSDMAIYKKTTDENAARQAADYLKNFDLNMIDLNTFDQLQLQSFSLTQDKEYGYNINFNLSTGYFNMVSNGNKWFEYDSSERLYLEDVPTDEHLFATANGFVKQYDIDVTGYGNPEIEESWLDPNSRYTDDLDEVYIPGSIKVIYPLLINQRRVYTTFGDPVGLELNIDLRENKVSSVSNMTNLTLESSDYPIETDTEKLLSQVQQGGYYELRYENPANTYDIQLGEQELAYITTYENGSQQYFIPALVFPVVEPSDFYKNRVVVPLVSGLLPEIQDVPEEFLGL